MAAPAQVRDMVHNGEVAIGEALRQLREVGIGAAAKPTAMNEDAKVTARNRPGASIPRNRPGLWNPLVKRKLAPSQSLSCRT
jgi:hypothetical protein